MLWPAILHTLNVLPGSRARRNSREFDAALRDPARAQRKLLSGLLEKNQDCEYGKRYGFRSIRSPEQYQQRVPIVTYDEIAPWVERMKAGESGILTSERVIMFEKSSGSASAAKFVPYTSSLRAQFQAALDPWIEDLTSAFTSLSRGTAYWLVTPLSRCREFTRGGIPVGFDNDAEYFGSVRSWLLAKTMAVPPDLAAVPDLEDCLYLTLRFLLQARELAFISVWNPSFLQILLARLELHGDLLARDLLDGKVSISAPLPASIASAAQRDAGQAEKLRAMLRQGRIEPKELWPRLELISCWTSANSAALKDDVQRAFPGVAIQGKGLLATEGVVSIPSERYQGCVAAVTSHFLEFIDAKSGRCHLISDLVEGKEYAVLLTTGGGFWRYQLGDRVRVAGFAERTPILDFVGKEDCVSDLRGEKLNAIFVAQALSELKCCRSATFAMLAPSGDAFPGYTLFVEAPDCDREMAMRLDEMLRTNPHYAYCRKLGQLAEPRVFVIRHGAAEAYLKRCESLGQRAGNVKLKVLDKRSGWEHVFEGSYASSRAEVCA